MFRFRKLITYGLWRCFKKYLFYSSLQPFLILSSPVHTVPWFFQRVHLSHFLAVPIGIVTAPKSRKHNQVSQHFLLWTKWRIADRIVNSIYKNISKQREGVRVLELMTRLTIPVWQEEDVLVCLCLAGASSAVASVAFILGAAGKGGEIACVCGSGCLCPKLYILGFCLLHTSLFLLQAGRLWTCWRILSAILSLYFKSSVHWVNLWNKDKLQRTSLPKAGPGNGEWTKTTDFQAMKCSVFKFLDSDFRKYQCTVRNL